MQVSILRCAAATFMLPSTVWPFPCLLLACLHKHTNRVLSGLAVGVLVCPFFMASSLRRFFKAFFFFDVFFFLCLLFR